jgi:hypothetical protein
LIRRASIGLIALAVVLYALLPYRWALDVRTRDRDRAARDHAATAALNVRIAHARAVAADPTGWAAQLALAQRALPPVVDVQGELTELRAVAAASGARLVSISADAPAPGPPPASVTVHVELGGDLAIVESFLTRLRAAPRLVTITRASFTFAAAAIDSTLTASVWLLPGAPPG